MGFSGWLLVGFGPDKGLGLSVCFGYDILFPSIKSRCDDFLFYLDVFFISTFFGTTFAFFDKAIGVRLFIAMFRRELT